jgi:hypothetical protein
MLSHQVCYHELGDLYLDKLNKTTTHPKLGSSPGTFGYGVTLEQKAA